MERLRPTGPQETTGSDQWSSEQLNPDGDEPKRMNRRRGEHEASRKPTARGTPDVSGAAVVTNSCAFLLCA
jgi:hypothetical protein